jgi:MYXO-CTERM domain-containing protein
MRRAAAVAVLFVATHASANSGGIAGYSGMSGMNCGQCHSGGVAPTVNIVGPTTLEVGQTATYRIDVISGATGQKNAGIDVAASDGTLAVHAGGTPTHLLLGEIVQNSAAGPASTVSFQFDFTAPGAPGTVTLFGDGLSCNFDSATGGDNFKTTRLAVTVVPAGSAPDAGEIPDAAPTVDAVTGSTQMAKAQGEPTWGCGCAIGSAEPPNSGILAVATLSVAGIVFGIRRRRR